MVREDENLGGSDRVEPLLDPAPDRREESRCANDLGASSVFVKEAATSRLTNIRSNVSG